MMPFAFELKQKGGSESKDSGVNIKSGKSSRERLHTTRPAAAAPNTLNSQMMMIQAHTTKMLKDIQKKKHKKQRSQRQPQSKDQHPVMALTGQTYSRYATNKMQ